MYTTQQYNKLTHIYSVCSEDEINPTTHYNAADGLPSLDSQVKGEENHFIDIYPQIILEKTLFWNIFLPNWKNIIFMQVKLSVEKHQKFIFHYLIIELYIVNYD